LFAFSTIENVNCNELEENRTAQPVEQVNHTQNVLPLHHSITKWQVIF